MFLNAGIDWKLLMDGIQMLLVLVVLALVLLNRAKSRRPRLGSKPGDLQPSFGGELNRQAVQQQMLAALDQVIRTAVAERSNVQRMFDDPVGTRGSEDLPFEDSADAAPSEAALGGGNPRKAFSDLPLPEPPAESNPRYADIRRLAAEGRDARSISETLGLPVGEVALLLKLRGMAPASRAACH
jgi:hypothetical protein